MIKYLVLPSAGYKILNLIGALYELHNNNFYNLDNIESIYGVSAGSVIGAVLCLKPDWDDIIKYCIERPWEKCFDFDTNDYLNIIDKKGIIGIDMLKNFINPFFECNDLNLDTLTLKELYDFSKINLNVYAVNTDTFKSEHFNHIISPEMKLIEAIYMSSSMPFVFKPIYKNDICYIDGGLDISYPINECINNEKCNIKEIFSMNMIDNNEDTLKILEKDDVFTYFYKLFIKLHHCNIRDKYIKNPYHMDILADITNLKDASKIITDENTRKKWIDYGINFSKEWLKTLD